MTLWGEIVLAIRTVGEIMNLAKKLIAFHEQYKSEKWYQESSQVFERLENAKTDEEARRAHMDYLKLLRGIRA